MTAANRRQAESSATRAIHIEVPSTDLLSAEEASTVIRELLKHFLYMRGQLPGVYDALYHKLQERSQENKVHFGESGQPNKRLRLSATERKLAKTVDSVQGVLELLRPELINQQRRWWLSFFIGPTIQKPHEVYDLIFEQVESMDAFDDSEEHHQHKAVQHQNLARKIIRTLIALAPNIPEGRASKGPTKFFLLMRSSASDIPPMGFIPRRGFQPKYRKCVQVVINLCGRNLGPPQSSCDTGESDSDVKGDKDDAPILTELDVPLMPTVEQGEDVLWYQCKTVIKGFCMSGR